MNIAIASVRNPAGAARASTACLGRIAGIALCHDFATARPAWTRLEAAGALASPYQRHEFLDPWQRHVGELQGIRPLIVTAWDAAGRPLLLLPLGYRNRGPIRRLQFLGGKHVNANLGLWDRDFAASATPAEIAAVIDRVASSRLGIDLIALQRLPLRWNGIANPLLLQPHQPAPSDSCRMELHPFSSDLSDMPLSHSIRKQLRVKHRKLMELAGFRYFKAETSAEVDRLLDWFFDVKSVHLAARGLTNAFAEPGVTDFIRIACQQGLAEGRPAIEIHAMEAGGELLALFAGTGDGRRFSAMFNSYTLGAHARRSPGLVLLTRMVMDLSHRGYRVFDLGVGDAWYKSVFCKHPEPLFDSYLPLTANGRIAAAAARSGTALKRRIKQSPRLWPALQAVRRNLCAKRL